ncbi:MAG: DUF4363 family protein [Oscillospiraceae bacterium]|nr:DUF4363 family protein [Oscillospiraceae bacterium]
MITMAAIWAAIFIFAIAGLVYFNYIKERLYTYIDAAANTHDVQEMVEYSDKILEKWESGSKFLRFFVRHNELDETQIICHSIKAYAEASDIGEFRSQLLKIRFLLKHMYESEMPLFGSIF